MKKIINLLNGNGKKVEGGINNHKILTLPYITERLLYKTNENYHIKKEIFLIPRNEFPELMLYSNIRLYGHNLNMSIGILFEEPACCDDDDEDCDGIKNCKEYLLLRLNDISLKLFAQYINQYICKEIDISKINKILNYKYLVKKNKVLQKNNVRIGWWSMLIRYDNEKYNTLKSQINFLIKHIDIYINRIVTNLINCYEKKKI